MPCNENSYIIITKYGFRIEFGCNAVDDECHNGFTRDLARNHRT